MSSLGFQLIFRFGLRKAEQERQHGGAALGAFAVQAVENAYQRGQEIVIGTGHEITWAKVLPGGDHDARMVAEALSASHAPGWLPVYLAAHGGRDRLGRDFEPRGICSGQLTMRVSSVSTGQSASLTVRARTEIPA